MNYGTVPPRVAGRKKKADTEPKATVDLDRTFAANLRSWRNERGYSQEALADRAELHRTEVGPLERGEREPKFNVINKLAGALGIEPGEFFRGSVFLPAEAGRKGRYAYDPSARPVDRRSRSKSA